MDSQVESTGIHNPVAYIFSEDLVKTSSLLPSNRNRSLLVYSLIHAYGLLTTCNDQTSRRFVVVRPRPAGEKELLAYHTHDYLKYAMAQPSDAQNLLIASQFGLEDDCPKFHGIKDYITHVAGATLTGAAVIRDEASVVAICWDGGRHHAEKARASGFCYVADCVLAILFLKRALPSRLPSRKPRVMYIDLDLHFSDAVSQAFHKPGSVTASQVLTLSIHHAAPGFFPVSPLASLPKVDDPALDPFTLSVPLKAGASAKTFLRIWPIVERVKDIFRPDFVVVQCGVDGLAGDPMATWNWSLGGEGSLGWCIHRIVHEWQGKNLLLGGGGYNTPNAARAWTYLTSVAGGKPLLLDADIPEYSGYLHFKPSFTLDVPAGNMQDQNTEEYLQTIEATYENTLSILHSRMVSQTLQAIV
ncbi:hypothetical protein AZE42_02207 [Rhizopogon vesiculosus]|uniref:histone deacetylase n=1 Tax=Rhizopogon vesiculosus TaxID=180088 RepID=A0A1J8QPT6_9AGAM|nr:hypothetical protein AZE42_02207 [Rhizopogon vesiculosus]